MSKRTLARYGLNPAARSAYGRTSPEGGGGGIPTPAPPATPAPAPAAPVAPAADRPDGVSETEWAALGDPGKTALVRERQRATAAEQALAAHRADPPPTDKDGKPDIAAIVQQAVQAAVNPLIERDAAREAAQAAEKIRDTVTTAAGERFHDASDALAQIDLTTLTDGNGAVDQTKLTAALDDLLTRKPHLGKAVDNRRRAPDGSPIGATPISATSSLEDRVKAQLALMSQQ